MQFLNSFELFSSTAILFKVIRLIFLGNRRDIIQKLPSCTGGCPAQFFYLSALSNRAVVEKKKIWYQPAMGACCTKFGSYLLRKEETKAISNGGTPRLNKLEHKQSFVASPTAENASEKSPQEGAEKVET